MNTNMSKNKIDCGANLLQLSKNYLVFNARTFINILFVGSLTNNLFYNKFRVDL